MSTCGLMSGGVWWCVVWWGADYDDVITITVVHTDNPTDVSSSEQD